MDGSYYDTPDFVNVVDAKGNPTKKTTNLIKRKEGRKKMANQIERDAFVKRDALKNPIPYTRGTDLLPIVIHFRDFQIPSGATARVFVAKPDGNAVYDTATIEGNDVTVDVTEQMFLVLGMTLMQISIFDGEEELVSFAQPVMVEQNLKAGDFPESVTDVKAIDEAIEQANQAVETATAAASQAAQAVQNANAAIADANEAISDLNEQIASMNANFATLANTISIPQLDTAAKTIVGAIDELNSKSYLLQGGTPIPENANLDDYATPGNYHCHLSVTARTLENSPFTSAFILKVEYGNGVGYVSQTAIRHDTGQKAWRYNNTSAWSDWRYFSDDDTVLGQCIQNVLVDYSNIDDYREGRHIIYGNMILNRGNAIGIEYQYTASGLHYGAQLILSYIEGLKFRQLVNSVWTDWETISNMYSQ